jgi:hypothetical protein
MNSKKTVNTSVDAKQVKLESEIADVLMRARSCRWNGLPVDDDTDYMIGFFQYNYPEEYRKVLRSTSN